MVPKYVGRKEAGNIEAPLSEKMLNNISSSHCRSDFPRQTIFAEVNFNGADGRGHTSLEKSMHV